MAYYCLLPLFGMMVNLLLGFYVIGIDARSRENRLFFLLTMALAFWCGINFLMHSAPTLELAFFWSRLDTWGTSFTAVLSLHFFLAYTRVRPTPMLWLILAILYIVALVLAVLDQTTLLIDTEPTAQPWGISLAPGPLYPLNILFILGCIGGGMLLMFRFHARAASVKERKQALLIIIAAAVPFFGGVFTEILPVFLSLSIPPLSTPLSTFMVLLVVYSIHRYKLMIPLEHQLRAVEEKYEKLFNTIPDAIALLAGDGRIMEVNDPLARTLGLTREEAIGRNVRALLPAEKAGGVMDTARAALSSGKIKELPGRLGERYYHNLYIPAWQLSGEYILWISRDITDQKRAEEALRAQEKSLADIIEGSPIPTYVLDAEHRVTHWNLSLERLTGISAADMIGTRYHWRVFYEKERPVIADLLLDGRLDQLEVYYKGKYQPALLAGSFEAMDFFPDLGGQDRWLHFTACPLRDNDGRVTAAITILQDFTDRKTAEEELRASEEKFRILAENANDIIWTSDLDLNLTYISPSLERLTGFVPEEAVGNKIYQPLPPDSKELALEAFNETMRREEAGESMTEMPIMELEHNCKDGSTIWIEVNIAVMRDSAGQAVGLMGVSRDISDRRKSQEALQEAKHQAEEANQAKSQFLANMSHEIRTPMNGILGMVELLSSTPLNAEQKEYADIIYNSANSLLEIINDILDVSRIEAGRMDIVAEPFNLLETVHGVKNILRYAAENKGLELIVDYDAPSMVIGDRTRVRQILMNLGANAVKFTKEGTVRIRVRYDTDQSLFILSVSDTGIGIPAKMHGTIFELFRQVDGGTARKYEGTGLGLSISRNLAELMGGKIAVESEEGMGSTFTVTLPLALSDMPAEEENSGEGDYAVPDDNMAVLVVEDNSASLLLMQHLLGKSGWTVETARDGTEALEKMQQQRYRAVFLDIHMPEMDGFEVARTIRDPDSPVLDHNLYIIAMTADAAEEDRRNCLAAGMNDYIAKPVNAEIINRALGRSFRTKQ
ncbi:MAG: PAS domain S-box protein [Desulfosudaceae bacterium]